MLKKEWEDSLGRRMNNDDGATSGGRGRGSCLIQIHARQFEFIIEAPVGNQVTVEHFILFPR